MNILWEKLNEDPNNHARSVVQSNSRVPLEYVKSQIELSELSDLTYVVIIVNNNKREPS